MATMNVTVSVKVSWWVRPLLAILAWLHRCLGLRLDLEALAAFLTKHGIRSSVTTAGTQP
ncbi:hypothetical protein [Cupriavidus sp. DL-D2]|uniref:hypothetical protein n=1 Tax=Cupriavidus sp. DL-D2 TaxID=3144974 RepID=UPI0032138345